MSLVPSVNGFEIDAGQEIPGEFEEISFAPVAGILKFPENTPDPDAIPPHDCKPFDIDSDLPMEEYCATGIPHSPCDPMPITVDVPCYTTVYVDTLPEEGIQGIMYVVPNGDLYAVYMWDGERFNAVTSSSILQALTVNPSSVAQDILPEQGYDGFSSVHVNPIPPEYIIPSGTKNITQNGNGQDVAAYEYVNVNVPTVTPTGEKTINVSQNGTVTEDVTNYASAKVVTNVPNTYSASDEGKVVQNGALASQTSLTVNQNGTYDTTTNNEVVVDVSGGAAIAIEDVPNATGVECQITGDYSGGTVTQDADGYVILSPSGGSSVASGTYTPASDETNPTIDPNVDSDMLLFYLSPDSNVNPLGNSKRVTYGGLWSKATNKRIFYMASNASGGSWTTISVDLSQTQPSGTAYNLNTDYLISGAIYQWYAWKIS